MNEILPLNLWQVPRIDTNFNPDYISNLIANGLIQDYFDPLKIEQNPFFYNINDFNEKIGILQTATQSIDTILNYVNILKNVNPDEKDVLTELTNEINSNIKNTSFDSSPVFNQTIQIGGQNIDLSLPLLNLNDTSIEEYEKLLTQKQKDIFNVLNNVTIQTPMNTNFNPFDIDTFENVLNSGLLTTAYQNAVIEPETLELLLS